GACARCDPHRTSDGAAAEQRLVLLPGRTGRVSHRRARPRGIRGVERLRVHFRGHRTVACLARARARASYCAGIAPADCRTRDDRRRCRRAARRAAAHRRAAARGCGGLRVSGQVFVAMSGGVDSSVAAALLRERGEDVVGVWMRLLPGGGADTDAPRCCGTDEAGEDARRAAATLGIPFYALDYAEAFGRQVVDRFVDSYASGETPNPCVSCNHHVKFDALLRDVVAKFGGARLATGHYARVADAPDGTRRLLRARDAAKDQSYALYMLGQRELSRTVFPIGELAN